MKATTQKPAVEQAEGTDESSGGEGDSLTPEQMKTALEDQGRRIEQLEQRVAETAGAPTNEAKPEGEAPADGEEEEDDPTMKPEEKPKEEKPVEQAQPAPLDVNALAAALGPVIEQAVTKHLDARGVTAKSVEQAAPAQPASTVKTPLPAAAPAAGTGSNPTLEARLIEACESGNPATLRSVWSEVHETRRQQGA